MIAEIKEVANAHKATQEATVFPLLNNKLDVGEIENLGRTMRIREQALRTKAADTPRRRRPRDNKIYPQL